MMMMLCNNLETLWESIYVSIID